MVAIVEKPKQRSLYRLYVATNRFKLRQRSLKKNYEWKTTRKPTEVSRQGKRKIFKWKTKKKQRIEENNRKIWGRKHDNAMKDTEQFVVYLVCYRYCDARYMT